MIRSHDFGRVSILDDLSGNPAAQLFLAELINQIRQRFLAQTVQKLMRRFAVHHVKTQIERAVAVETKPTITSGQLIAR